MINDDYMTKVLDTTDKIVKEEKPKKKEKTVKSYYFTSPVGNSYSVKADQKELFEALHSVDKEWKVEKRYV
jgi:hypothetical protein